MRVLPRHSTRHLLPALRREIGASEEPYRPRMGGMDGYNGRAVDSGVYHRAGRAVLQ